MVVESARLLAVVEFTVAGNSYVEAVVEGVQSLAVVMCPMVTHHEFSIILAVGNQTLIY